MYTKFTVCVEPYELNMIAGLRMFVTFDIEQFMGTLNDYVKM